MTTATPTSRAGTRRPASKPAARDERAPSRIVSRERRLFDALRDGAETIEPMRLSDALATMGIASEDPRLDALRRALGESGAKRAIDFERFQRIVETDILLIERALQGRMVIPDFSEFGREIRDLFESSRENRDGVVANYIPQLGRVPAEQFGLALCTVDGQRMSVGDASVDFCIQSVSKSISYCLALEEHGEQVVHRHVGFEPSGQRFNELALNGRGRPHNPMINAGGIMSCALVRRDESLADRFDHVMSALSDLAGGAKPGFSNSTYLSERRTADRNFALGYFMRENGAFPADIDLVETLEFYFQCCSIEMTAESLSVVAGTLANGGICPTTGKRILGPQTVQKCLSLMSSCGMYDYSGEWAFTVGLPAKSGVSGVIILVVPNVLGVCIWSPRLDAHGNSVRGIDFAERLVSTFNFHNYDNVNAGAHEKKDPRRGAGESQNEFVEALCWAASKGDTDGIRRLVARGAALDGGDYDGRTALHLAASEGHVAVVKYLLARGVEPNPRDRWGGTPRDDAMREGHAQVVALLGEAR